MKFKIVVYQLSEPANTITYEGESASLLSCVDDLRHRLKPDTAIKSISVIGRLKSVPETVNV